MGDVDETIARGREALADMDRCGHTSWWRAAIADLVAALEASRGTLAAIEATHQQRDEPVQGLQPDGRTIVIPTGCTCRWWSDGQRESTTAVCPLHDDVSLIGGGIAAPRQPAAPAVSPTAEAEPRAWWCTTCGMEFDRQPSFADGTVRDWHVARDGYGSCGPAQQIASAPSVSPTAEGDRCTCPLFPHATGESARSAACPVHTRGGAPWVM